MSGWSANSADRLPAVLSLGVLLLLLATAALRMPHPFDLEWMEGGMLVHAQRVVDGQPLYVRPSADFVPFIYPPLYHYVLGGLGAIFGVSHPLGRAISLVGSLAAAAAAAVAVRREGAGWGLAAAAAGLFLSGYDDTGTFFDLVRADGLTIGLLSWALVLGRAGAPVPAGLLLAAAFAAKHNAAAFGLPMLVWISLEQGRAAGLRFGLASVLPALAFLAVMQLEGDGLFLTYLLGVPAAHPMVGTRVFPGTFQELGAALPLPCALLLGALTLRLRRGALSLPTEGRRGWGIALAVGLAGAALAGALSPTNTEPLGPWLGLVVGAGVAVGALCLLALALSLRAGGPVPATPGDRFWVANGALAVVLSAVMRGHHGGFVNVLIPGLWALSVGGALALHRLRAAAPEGWIGGWGPALGALALSAQLGLGLWSPADKAPRPGDREAGEALVARLAAEPGPVWVPSSPWLAVQAGHAAGPHLIALWDITHKDGPLDFGRGELKAAVTAQRWALIIGDNARPEADLKGYGLQEAYRRAEDFTPAGQALAPRVGWRSRPRWGWRPRAEAPLKR